jgi:predicted enzyme related to lactoylglutathione lyase
MLQPSVPAWFEIPAADLERAVLFYETVLEARLTREDMGPTKMAVFPHEKPAPSGAVAYGPAFTPGPQGTVVYLNVSDLTPVLKRIPAAGGSVRLPRTALPEGMGFFAQFQDSEGNVVGLFSEQ